MLSERAVMMVASKVHGQHPDGVSDSRAHDQEQQTQIAEAAEALSLEQRAALILPALGTLVPGIIPT
jgi:hypothetical protein